MSQDQADEFAYGIAYRIGYGHAANIVERFRIGPNATGRDVARVLARVLQEAGGDPQDREAFEEGVEDAIAGRKPKW